MAWYEWIVSFLLFIVALGMLITIHEAGHLSMAKLFKVYCHEFSIGFGPKLLKKRKEGKETYFSIRAIPLGGYVSMYGEDETKPEDMPDIGEDRSLEGVKKWKKAIIVSAGIILNALVAFVLIAVSNIAFPIMHPSSIAKVEESSLVQTLGVNDGDKLEFIFPDYKENESGIESWYYEFTDSKKEIHADSFYIVDNNVTLENGYHYILCYSFTGNKGDIKFVDGLKLYQAVAKADIEKYEHVNELFKDWKDQAESPEYYPNIEENVYKIDNSTKFTANVSFLAENDELKTVAIPFETKESGTKVQFADIGLYLTTVKEWLPFGERVKNTFKDYGDASVAVFKGLGVLFTGGLRNMSGVVGIFQTSASLYSNYTFATYLYFWGLISVNLAIFNLLPFPGLDGWQLLVTAVEGISKKKIPTKLKGIMSAIGLGLLFLLMIVIVVFDVLRIAGM